jgi:hypothetical protein
MSLTLELVVAVAVVHLALEMQEQVQQDLVPAMTV